MDNTITRPRRELLVRVEPSKKYTFYLSVPLMEEFRRAAERERMAYSVALEEGIRLFLATRIPNRDRHQREV